MKKRIFISIHSLHLGGAETSLIGFLNALNPDEVDIDLQVYSHEGELMDLIPDYVNLLPEEKRISQLERPMVELFKKGYMTILVARILGKFRTNVFRLHTKSSRECGAGMGYISYYVNKLIPDINPSVLYDLAISFLIPHIFTRDHVRAKKKICWIHTDYSMLAIDAKWELPIWGGYDYIASISPKVTDSFLSLFPSLRTKIIEIENILSSAFVRDRSNQTFNNDLSLMTNIDDVVNLLSVGRFCEAKNYDNVPDICKRIIDLGCNIKWYIIGFGIDEPLIRQKIAAAGMEEYVIILGKKENPYPYIKACDIYVQPSRYEGKSVTVREAQMLCKPVVVTNYPTASSQIQDGVDGVIVPMDNEGCANGIAELILDKVKQKQIIEYLQAHDYGNETEIEKIYKLIEQ